MSEKRAVVRPRAKTSAAKVIPPSEETAPGDVIELAITEEIKGNGGSRWVRVGLSSTHRPDETSEEAVERVQDFVLTGLDEFIKASK